MAVLKINHIKKIIFVSTVILLLVGQIQYSFCQTTINMQKEGGVYVVPCTVNGLNLKFIFDTGASDVSISLTEALFMLKNGYMSKDDVLDKQYYTDANGDISEGTRIIIRKIEFAGLILNDVQASVVNNLEAPLLLGQTAILKLGAFQIDPIKNTLTIINGSNNNSTNNTNQKNTPAHSEEKTYPCLIINKPTKYSTTVWSATTLRTSSSIKGGKIKFCPAGTLIEVINDTDYNVYALVKYSDCYGFITKGSLFQDSFNNIHFKKN